VRKKPQVDHAVKRSLSLPPDVSAWLVARAKSRGQTLSYVIKTALKLLRSTEEEQK
jgi:hypothetical protein